MPKCDFPKCSNKAFKEVYPGMMPENYNKRNSGWSYLCRKHFKSEQKRLRNRLPYAGLNGKARLLHNVDKKLRKYRDLGVRFSKN